MPDPLDPDGGDPLDAVVADYLQKAEAGTPPDRDELLAAHPELADRLRAFFANLDDIGSRGESFRLPHLALPEDFGDYEFLGEIGRGGMGVVYRVRQKSLGRIVALKMILSGPLADASALRRFREEAEALSRLDHPHIVPVYEVGEHRGLPFFTMKLIEGTALTGRLDQFHGDPKVAAELLAKVCDAVDHAHQRGVLHRDLKPGNILVDAAGEPHVTDFGLSRQLEEARTLTSTGAVLGTPEYMAPEQAAGEKDVTTAVDVYSLGAVFYALLTNRPPFRAETAYATVRQVVEELPLPPRKRRRTTPRDLDTICMKCLEKSPGRRYSSAKELAAELRRWVAGKPILTRPSGRVARVWKWARRRPTAAALVCISSAAAVVVVVGAIALAIQSAQLTASLQDARTQRGLAEERATVLGQQAEEITDKSRKLRDQVSALERSRYDLHMTAYTATVGLAERIRREGNPLGMLEQLDACGWNVRGWEHDHLTLHADPPVFTFSQRLSVSQPLLSHDGTHFVGWYRTKETEPPTITAIDIDRGIAVNWPKDEVPNRLAKLGMKLDAAGIPALLDKPKWSLRLGTEMNWLAVVDAKTGQVRCELEIPPPDAGDLIRAGREKPKDFDPNRTWRTECALSFDGTLVAGAQDGELVLWSGWTGKILVRRKLHDTKITAIGFRRGDNLLATVDYDRKKLSLTDPYTGRLVRTIQYDNTSAYGIVNRLTFSGDGSRIWVGGGVWNVRAPEPIVALPTQCDSPTGFAFARTAKKVIYSGSDERFAQPRAVLQIAPVHPPRDNYPRYPHPFEPLRGASHEGKVNAVDISADGKVVATAGDDGTVRVWQPELVEQGELVREWDGHQELVTTTGFAPTGEWCFTGTERELIAWDAASLKERFRCTLPKDHKGTEVLFAPDGKRFFWGGCLWQTGDGAHLHVLNGRSAAFAPQGDRIATFGGSDKVWAVWDTQSGKKVYVSKLESQVMGAFLPDGNTLLTCQIAERWAEGRQCSVSVFDVAVNKWIGTVRIHASDGEFAHLHRIAVSSDGKRIALTARMQRRNLIPNPQWRSQFVWDAAKLIERAKSQDPKNYEVPKLGLGEALLDLTKSFSATNEIVWDPNGPLLHYRPNYWGHDPFNSGLDPWKWILVVRDRRTGKEQPVEAIEKILLPDRKRDILKDDGNNTEDVWFYGTAALGPDGRTAISSGFWKGKVKVWRIADTHTRGIFKGHKGPVHAVALSPDARRIASAGADGTVRLWDSTGKQLHTIEAHAGSALAVVFSPDSATVASAGADGMVRLWDIKNGKLLRDLSGHAAPVRGLSYSPDGKQLASASDDHTLRVWSADTGESQQVITGHIGPVHCVAFDTEGKLLASGGRDGTVRVWDTNGKAITSLQLHKDSVCGVVWTGLDYAPLLSISEDQTMRRWKKNDAGAWAEVPGSMRILSRNRVECQAMSPAPDGRHVYATDQGAVVVWDLKTKKIVRTIGGPESRELILVSEEGSMTSGDNRPLWTVPLGGRWDVVTASPDGKYVAVMSRNWWSLCDLLDARTGESVWYRDGSVGSKSPLLGPMSGAPTTAPAFSPDGKYLLVWNTLLDVRTGAEVRKFRSPVGGNGWTSNTSWDRIQPFSPDGKLVALGSSPVGEKSPSVCIWNVETGELLHKLGTNPQHFNALAWSNDGSRIAIAYSGSTRPSSDIQVFDVRTGAEIATCSGSGMTDALVFTADGNRIIASNSSSGTGIQIWDARTGKHITRLPQYWRMPFDSGEYTTSTPGVNVLSDHWGAEMLAMSPQGSRLFGLRRIYDHGAQIVAWDVPEVPRPLALPFSANTFQLSLDRRFLLGDVRLEQWNVLNLATGQSQRFQSEHARPMWFHPQSRVLYSADGRCIDPDSGKVLSRWLDGSRPDLYHTCAMTADGQRIVSMVRYWPNERNVRIKVHDLQGKVVGVCISDVGITKSDSAVNWNSAADAVFVPSVPCVLFAFPDNTIRTWKLPEEHATEQEAWKAAKPPVELIRCAGHTGLITDLGVSDDGTRVVSASEDGTVRVWNLKDGTELRKFADHGGPVQRAAINPDGKRVAAVGQDRRVMIWNADTGERMHSFIFPDARSFQFVGFINGGRELICVGDERWLRVWDVSSGRILRAPNQEKQ